MEDGDAIAKSMEFWHEGGALEVEEWLLQKAKCPEMRYGGESENPA